MQAAGERGGENTHFQESTIICERSGKNMRVKKALEKYLGSIYPAAEVEIFDFCFCGRANIAVMSDIAFGVECQWSFVSRVV